MHSIGEPEGLKGFHAMPWLRRTEGLGVSFFIVTSDHVAGLRALPQTGMVDTAF